ISPEDFMSHLQAAIERARVEFPLGTRDAGTTTRVMAARDLAEFRSAAESKRSMSSFDQNLSYLITLDPPRTEPPSFLPSTLPVFGVSDPAQALRYLTSHGISLEALAVDSNPLRPDIAYLAVQSGASRIARFGEL